MKNIWRSKLAFSNGLNLGGIQFARLSSVPEHGKYFLLLLSTSSENISFMNILLLKLLLTFFFPFTPYVNNLKIVMFKLHIKRISPKCGHGLSYHSFKNQPT